MRPVSALLYLALPVALFAVSGVARAQRLQPTPVQRVIAEHWRIVPDDTASLAHLARASVDAGGETVVRAIIDAARSPGRPFGVRIEALTILVGAVRPGTWIPRDELIRQDAEPEADCVPSAHWSPGDTLRVCYVPSRRMYIFSSVDHPDYRLASSIEPPLRDTIAAMVSALAASDPDPRVARAASLLREGVGGWSSDPLGLRPCPHPAPTARPCRGAALPPLAARWSTVADDSSLAPLLGASQRVRDRRLQAVLKRTALDRGRPQRVRLAALDALATLADPRMNTLGPRSWRKPARWQGEDAGCINWGWHAHHAVQWEGAVPMRPDSRREIEDFLFGIARSKHSLPVRKHASRLAHCVFMLRGRAPYPGP